MDNETLKKLQKTELEILLEVDRICKKNNLRYQLNSGTLLGAIRHKGFIPWDDDIDITMPVEDYNKFCKICRSELDERFSLQTIITDNFFHFFAKVRKNGTKMVEEGAENLKYEGIWIDIFPLVGVKNSEAWILKRNGILEKIRLLLKKRKSTAPWKQLSVEKKILRLIPMRLIIGVVTLFLKHLLQPTMKYDHCCYIWGGELLKIRFPGDLFDETCEVEFEGHLFPAPKQYDKYLTIVYGDYMTPPPPEKRNGGCHTVSIIDFGEAN